MTQQSFAGLFGAGEGQATRPEGGPEAAAALQPLALSPTLELIPAGRQSRARPSSGETPMMEQFLRAKREQPDALIFFRMGDFYELFGDDAVLASRELGIALTSRSKGEDALPMAGVPVRAVDSYLIRLVRKGLKVAICEQLSDPREARGIVERGIVRVVTRGTLTEEEALDARINNYLAAAWRGERGAGLAWIDVSTGVFRVSEFAREKLGEELVRLAPAELLASRELIADLGPLAVELQASGCALSERDSWRFERESARRALTKHFKVLTLEGFGLADDSAAIPPAGALIEYAEETQRSACAHVRRIERVQSADFLVLDRATRTCLELVTTQSGERREGTLLAAIDASLTPMGSRLMREWLLAPLVRAEPILERQHAVAEFHGLPILRGQIRALLADIKDVERLAAKVATLRAGARDLVALAASLALVPALLESLSGTYSARLCALRDQLDPLRDLTQRILGTLVEAPPLASKEGGLVRAGVSAELDELRQIAGDGKQCMARFQAAEIERTGIQGLKVGFNSVFGYYLEIPRGQAERAPASYIRKQTVKNAERYITPELKEFESKVLRAEELAVDLEYKIFLELRGSTAQELTRVLDTAAAIAQIDVLAALAQRAAEQRYVAPQVEDSATIEIRDGRHPVIERGLAGASFVPNDSLLDDQRCTLTVLTGPNMAGKSTYIRQTALIVLLAQMGSFVPASSARIGLADRIFTRLGAGDDISRGSSTFMVEMVEIANILNNASARSLVILDEVGRGTSTFDGLALAWAIAEFLSTKIGARTLFATHYHQLTELAERNSRVTNRAVAVREWGDEIVFLHRIVEGGTDRSYGLHVARLAGVPPELLTRAKAILADLEEHGARLAPALSDPPSETKLFSAPADPNEQLGRGLILELRQLDPNRLTPLEALVLLQRWREQIDGGGAQPRPG